jgi:prevent-host-death family protein
MQVTVRELRNDTGLVIDALESGEEVTLTKRGHLVGRIVPAAFDMQEWLAAFPFQPAGGQLDELLADRDAEYAEPDIW